ncbi:NAD-dependent epimerase/dehydratase family protein, partial [Rhodoferax sp. 4810]|nr:NAD-dependent epimerase/dehydratase family protein [Rhodoferax jenense]
AHTYSHLFGLPTTGLRFFTVYGPWGRPDMALFIFTKAIREGKPIQVFNNGNMVRDFTYIDDIVEGVTRVIDSPPSTKTVRYGLSSSKEESPGNEGEVVVPETLNPEPTTPYAIYNIGNSSPVQLSDFITAIEQNLGKTAIRENRPMQPGDVPYTEADVTDLIKNLDYKPNTPVATGIKEFIDWYQMYFKV